jgi:type IV pilus assembly protein PilQ
MSVLSKALLGTVFVSMISGCAVHSSSGNIQSETSDAFPASEMSSEMSSETETLLQTTELDSQAETVLDSRQLVSADEAGFEINLEKGRNFTRFMIETGQADPVFNVFSLDEPSRVVLDLLGNKRSINKSVSLEDDQFLSGLRLGNHNDRARIVFDLTTLGANEQLVSQSIDNEENRLVVTFLDSSIPLASIAPSAFDLASTDIIEATEVIEAEVVEPKLSAETPQEEKIAPLLASTNIEEDPAVEAGLTLDIVTFTKDGNSAGQVVVGLNTEAAYELRRTSQSEYMLSIPGAKAAAATKLPQIAEPGTPGIRTVRAVQEGDVAQVRMFVDPAVHLKAVPKGNSILVTALSQSSIGANPDARGQLTPFVEEGEGDVGSESAPDGGILAADGSKRYTGRLISLDLQDTDIDNALRIIAEVSNLNIIASDDVRGKVTLRLIDVPWDQALDVILKTNGLDQVQEGNVIRIAPVEKLRQEALARKEKREAEKALEELTVSYIRVSYARVTDIQDQVESVLSERGTVTVDERTNQLIIKDIVAGHNSVRELISFLDLRTPQVLLETQIVEAQRNILRDLGFQWNLAYSASPETGNATGYNFPNSVVVGGSARGTMAGPGATGVVTPAVNFPAAITDTAGSAISAIFDSADGTRALSTRLSALETEGKVRVISRPQVATVNNKAAQIKSVETVRVRLPDSGLSVATGSGASAGGGGDSAFEEIDVGIQLFVTPQASPDYYVLLDIEAKSSTFGSTVVDNIPSTLDRQATSTILVKSGQTFALGGVYRLVDTDQLQGVPFLKDVPFFGHFFRRSFSDKSDEELIFFITPHIVEGSFDKSLMDELS